MEIKSPSSPSQDYRKIVVGIGAATWDSLWLVDSFSADERVTQVLAHAEMSGGPVATALCVLGSLGHSAALIDVQGDDAASALIRADLEKDGVSTDHLQSHPGATSPAATVTVRCGDGARQILYAPSSAGEPQLRQSERNLIAGAHLLHINGRHELAATEAVQWAQAQGVTISFDGGAGRYRESVRGLFEASHLRIVAYDFARRYTGLEDRELMLDRLIEGPAQLAVITEGTRGSWVALPDGTRLHQPAHIVSPVVDTTGCGDVFHGAFLHGWLCGWEAGRCAEFASQLAATNALGLGGKWCLRQPRPT